MFKNYYQILGLDRHNFHPDQLRNAFREAAKRTHPDQNRHLGEDKATEMFKDVNEAYMCLKDPEARRKYDEIFNLRDSELRRDIDADDTTTKSGFRPFWQREKSRQKTAESDRRYRNFRREYKFDPRTEEIIRETRVQSEKIREESRRMSEKISEESRRMSEKISKETRRMSEEISEETRRMSEEISEETRRMSEEISEETRRMSEEIRNNSTNNPRRR